MQLSSLAKNPIVIVITTILALVFWWSLAQTQRSISVINQDVTKLEQEVILMENEVGDLETTLQQATSAATREKIIRNELLLQQPGEIVVQIPYPDSEEEKRDADGTTETPLDAWGKLLFRAREVRLVEPI